MRRSLLCSLLLLVCFSCSRPIPEITGVDLNAWKDDSYGCKGNRKTYVGAIREQRDKLKGLSERDLVNVLGKPDKLDLSEHHEKFYYYYIVPVSCDPPNGATTSLIVRINATGVSKEVTLEEITAP